MNEIPKEHTEIAETFELTKWQMKKFKRWSKGRSGTYAFTFVPNGIGDGVRAKDLISGEEINLTDYSVW